MKLDYNSTQFARNEVTKYFSLNNGVVLDSCKDFQVEAQRMSAMIAQITSSE